MDRSKPNSPIREDSKTNNSDQYRRFVEKARELGCDEDMEAFDAKLRVIARQKPKDEPKAQRHKKD